MAVAPLDEVYPIFYLDALYVNIKVSGRVSKRAVYVVTQGDQNQGCLPERRCRFQADVSGDEQHLEEVEQTDKNWQAALSHFAILFPERFSI